MPPWTVAVACASLKGGRADWLVEKCCEHGAQQFIPVYTERSPVRQTPVQRTRRWCLAYSLLQHPRTRCLACR
jgi:16S rRNA U1498 N3-methylase RsmE